MTTHATGGEHATAPGERPGEPAAAATPVPALSVAGAARGLGVAAATLRSWERRYGLAPSLHTKGGHRRYGPTDLARLAVMHRLVREGVPPAEAARVAVGVRLTAEPAGPFAALLQGTLPAAPDDPDSPAEVAYPPDVEPTGPGAARSSGGGRVLPMPHRSRTARGLARSAMAMDAHSCHRTVEAALATHGTVVTWDEIVRPVLAAIGDRWEQSGRGVEVEHSFSVVVAGALSARAARLVKARNDRPVVLASVPDELHDLPLVALQAALADAGVRSHLIGARTPDDALCDGVQRLGPPVVFLWSQMGATGLPTLPPMRPHPTLMVGGPGWPAQLPQGVGHLADLAGSVGAVMAAMGLAPTG